MSETLKQKVYLDLKTKILNNQLKEGEFLREAAISEMLEVSRTPVREAINSLENENLVQTIPNKGTFVTTISTQNVKELFQVRHLIEPIALKLSFPYLNNEILFDFRENFAKNIEENNYKELHILDYEFHNYLNSLCHNQYLLKMLDSISDDFQRVRTQDFYTKERTVGGAEEHLTIIDYLMEENLEEAITLLEDHISSTEKYYFKSLIE